MWVVKGEIGQKYIERPLSGITESFVSLISKYICSIVCSLTTDVLYEQAYGIKDYCILHIYEGKDLCLEMKPLMLYSEPECLTK